MKMTPDQAAHLLDSELRQYPWYLSIGVRNTEDGQPILFVYTKTKRHRELSRFASGWMGYKVLIRPIGSIRPVNVAPRYAVLG
jgi:hypothetical protein